MQREMEPAYSRWTGWIGFGGLMMIVIGSVDVLEGLIAVIRDKYYALGPNQIIVFDMTTWGWLTMLWGLDRRLRRVRAARAVGLGPLVRDRGREPERPRAARVPRPVAVAALVADHDQPEHPRALRADRPLGRRRVDALSLDSRARASFHANGTTRAGRARERVVVPPFSHSGPARLRPGRPRCSRSSARRRIVASRNPDFSAGRRRCGSRSSCSPGLRHRCYFAVRNDW